ncbi:filamentous hemagglutinin N-terminal domain-containing protein [Leptolyngbya sp. PL-A3]|uniref:two-partner secretion domain-containing protein n=1 Tax=Leptolyngbya sp. PL-A3 TaxID=2933911 RepID=UPI003299A914
MLRTSLFSLRSLTLLMIAIGNTFLCPPVAQSQVRSDGTLPNPTLVRSQGNRLVITGGSQAGTNLFHSFQLFSVPGGEIASFRLSNGNTTNVISRVTGPAASRIDGGIEVLQPNGAVSPANFFLINPHGIIFGPNASLNIGGSFLATTAERLTFADGTAFSAVNTRSSLLTVSVPTGLQFGLSPGPIRNESLVPLLDENGNVVLDEQSGAILSGGLQLIPDRTLAFIGGMLAFPEGAVTVPDGRVEFGSVGAGSTVRLVPVDEGWRIDYQGVQDFQDIYFDAATIDVSGEGGGSIQAQGRRVTLTNETFWFADVFDRDGGEIRIRASEVLMDGSSEILSASEGAGRTANIVVEGDRLTLRNGSNITLINTASGNTGNLTVTMQDSIDLQGGVVEDNEWLPSGLFNQIGGFEYPDTEGNGGKITLTTSSLNVLSGAQISTTTFAIGNAGAIQVTTNQVVLDGVALNEGQLFAPRSLPSGSGIFAGTEQGSRGDGGALSLTTEQLSILNGAVLQTTTFGLGNAGDMQVQASNFIRVSGADIENRFPSSIIASSGGIPGTGFEGFPEATGRGGTLQIQTDRLQLTNRGTIAVGSLNSDENRARGGGRAIIEANVIELSDRGRILTATASGNGGDVQLRARDLIFLQDNSQISTNAGSARTGGNGGNITIDSGFIITALPENSDITANAYNGAGGAIAITARGVFGIAVQPALTNQSDITASSELGVNGTIQINAPNTDPTRGLVALASTPVNAQLDQRCQTGGSTTTSRFVETGRGGLPPGPDAMLGGSGVWDDRRLPTEFADTTVQPAQSVQPATPLSSPSSPIIEAQGWIRSDRGEVVLTANSPTVVPYSSWQSPTNCQNL